MLNDELRDLAYALLNDDMGVSEQIWDQLSALMEAAGESELLDELNELIGETEKRYKIK